MRSDIITWNPINTRTSSLHACVYIKPTLEVLEFFNRSPNHKTVVKIGGTDGCYDGQNVFATIEKSSDIPSFRENFYNSTGLYVIVLNRLWYGFPLKNGYVEYQEGIVDNIINYISKCEKGNANELNKKAVTKEVKEKYEEDKRLKEEYEEEEEDKGLKEEYEEEDKGLKEEYEEDKGLKEEYEEDKGLKEEYGRHHYRKSFDKTILLVASFALILIFIVSLNTSNNN
jgi:hypothetical protein